MKRFLTLALAVILVLSLCITALGAEYTGEVDPVNVLLMNADTGEVLYSKNESASAYSAGLVKLMTAYVTVKSVEDLDTVVTVSSGAFSTLNTNSDITLYPRLKSGEQITVRDLLGGMLVASGNDCALALANYIGGTASGFVEIMNSTAQELGMSGTRYKNPTGKHHGDQVTTASDVAKLVTELLKYPELVEIFDAVSYTIPATNKASERIVFNTNRLICAYADEEDYVYDDATGMIAGYTSSSASCLAATARRDGTNLICIILGDISASRTTRWTLAADLFDFGFEVCAPIPAGDFLSDIPLTYSGENGTEFTVEPDFTGITVKYGTAAEGISVKVSSDDNVTGTAVYTDAEGNTVAEVPVSLTEIIVEAPEEPEITEEPETVPEEVPEEEPEKEKKERKGRTVLAIIISVIILAAAIFGANFLVKKKSKGRHSSENDSFKVKFRQNFMTYLLFAIIAVILIIIICAILI